MFLEQYFSTIIAINSVLIIAVYSLHLERYITEPKWKAISQRIALAYILVGVVLLLSGSISHLSIGVALSFTLPFLHLTYFNFLFNWFVKKYDRKPENVTYNYSNGLMKDRALILFFFLSSLLLSFTLMGFFLWNSGVSE